MDVTFTLRMPEEKNEKLRIMAQELDISQNALIKSFIDLSMKAYENIIFHQQEEFRHFLSQNQQPGT